mgnify:CR=1 FL=1
MKIVIVGGGFAGMRLARKLNNKPGFDVLIVDKFNYHQFQPLFYQVATAALDASNISFPLRKAFHDSKNVRIRVEEVKQIVPKENKIVTDSEEIHYDMLVLACGADTNFFGNQELAEKAFPMKSTVEALQLRHRFIQNMEDALIETDWQERQKFLNIVLVGGGPTGVELAGAMAEMKKYVLPKDYPEIDFSQMAIYLVEGGPRLLGGMSEASSADALAYLKKLGVQVILNTVVKTYDGNTATLADGNTIETALLVWAAGIKGNVLPGIDPALVVRGARVKVDRYNRMEGYENVFVLGDLAAMTTEKYPNGHPQVASVAIQQAENLYRNLRSGLTPPPVVVTGPQPAHNVAAPPITKGSDEEAKVAAAPAPRNSWEQWKAFEYYDKGAMATVGRNLAVVDIPKPKLHMRGLIAWLIWMGLHLFLILGVKNRLFVFFNWVYSYVTYDQSLRLIFKEFYRDKPKFVVEQQPVAAKA